jgi:hypothetical protein
MRLKKRNGLYSFGKDLITRKESDAYARKRYPTEREKNNDIKLECQGSTIFRSL